jgi:hypothetical protein
MSWKLSTTWQLQHPEAAFFVVPGPVPSTKGNYPQAAGLGSIRATGANRQAQKFPACLRSRSFSGSTWSVASFALPPAALPAGGGT